MNPLSDLLELAQQREDLDEKILRTVAAARNAGASWQTIANKIGGTKQAAQQRYGKLIATLTPEDVNPIFLAAPQLAAAEPSAVPQLAGQTSIALDPELDPVVAGHVDRRDGEPVVFAPIASRPAKCPHCGQRTHIDRTRDNGQRDYWFHTAKCLPTKKDEYPNTGATK